MEQWIKIGGAYVNARYIVSVTPQGELAILKFSNDAPATGVNDRLSGAEAEALLGQMQRLTQPDRSQQ